MPGEPKAIGRYEVKRVLGHGAMGIVFLAFDPLLKRPLAIKTVRDAGADQESTLLRFQREAQISARLNHPNIVTVHDVGQDAEAGPFLAMEFIDGLPLSELIQQGIPTETAMHLLLQGMSALQAAEQAGITHRDVKPANILVSHDGRLKLTDFGIARSEGTRLTQTGQIMGTPSYTAPEALMGTEPSGVSDRYAFAVTAFQMLTGALPFECATIAATLFRIVHEPPLYPEGMGPQLRAVFEKALAKQPADRYPDLAGFMGALIAAAELPADTRTKLLAAMAAEAGAEVAHLIRARAEETAGFGRDLPTQATPMPSRPFPPGTDDLATEAFRTPRPAAAPKRGWSWPWWAAAGALAAGVLGVGVWELPPRSFLLDVTSSPDGAKVLLGGREIGRTDLLRARIPGNGGTLRVELEGYQPEELEVRKGAGPIHLVLTRPPFTVRVDTDPPGAEALLNGVSQGTTPIQALQVPGNGRQELVLRWRDRQVWSQLLDKDTPLPALIQLEPRPVAARPRAAAPAAPSGKPVTPPAPVLETRAPVEARPPVPVRIPVVTAPPAAPVLKAQTPAEDRGRR